MKRMIVLAGILVLAGCGIGASPLATDSISEGASYNEEKARGAWETATDDVDAEAMRARDTGLSDLENAREYLYTRGIQEVRHGKQRKDGSDGVDGMNGVAGHDGMDGSDGLDGTAGRGGDPGAAGADGLAGTNGTDGEQGPTGADGIDGNDGLDGEDGARGPRGSHGRTGRTGRAGQDGEDGTSCELQRRPYRCSGHRLYYKIYVVCGSQSEYLGTGHRYHRCVH